MENLAEFFRSLVLLLVIMIVLDLHKREQEEGRRAERVGFEPTRTFALPVFKTGAINHSTTSPVGFWEGTLRQG